jgi:hypothetical protein
LQLGRVDVDYHRGQAAYFRDLAAAATTGFVKVRLLQEADWHDRIARGKPAPAITDEWPGTRISAPPLP